MKACAFCAEEIQDAAVICRHCDRQQPSAQSELSDGNRARTTKNSRYVLGILLVAFVAIAGIQRWQARNEELVVSTRMANAARVRATADSAAHSREIAVRDSMLRAERRGRDSLDAVTPRLTALLDGSSQIAHGGYQFIQFTIFDNAHCTVVGSVSGLRGETFEALVLPEDQMVLWQANSPNAQPVWRSGIAPTTTLNVSLETAGKYDVVISNRGAWLLAHTVDSRIQLRCTRVWPAVATN